LINTTIYLLESCRILVVVVGLLASFDDDDYDDYVD